MIRFLFIGIFAFFTGRVSAQHIKALSFELRYLDHQPALTESHKEALAGYLEYLQSDEIIIFNIDTSITQATVLEHQQRIQFLRTFLEERGVPPTVIHVMQKQRDTSNYKSSAYDVMRCKIIYSTSDRDRKMIVDTTQKTPDTELGMIAVGKFGSTTCTEKTSVLLKYDVELTLNACDYDRFQDDLIFNRMDDPQPLFKSYTISKENTQPLCAYNFNIQGNKSLMFPPLFKIPIESCMDKEDLSVAFCKNGVYTLIPIENQHDPEAKYITLKIPDTGQLLLMYTSHLKTYKIKVELEKKLTIIDFRYNLQCYNLKFSPTIKKNKATIDITETYYEPVISIKAIDKQGHKYDMVDKPLRLLERGVEKLKDFRVYHLNSKTEQNIPVFKKYLIPTSELKRVQE